MHDIDSKREFCLKPSLAYYGLIILIYLLVSSFENIMYNRTYLVFRVSKASELVAT